MLPKELLNKTKSDFEAALEFYKNDIASIKTGRATPSLVENILVEYYGQKLKIKELASISVPEPRSLLIQPWDKNSMEAINGAILKSNIGINPIADGQSIRLNIPALTEERRKEFVKLLGQKTEETRIKIRRIREDVLDALQKGERAGEIREDEKFKSKDELQKMTDDYNGRIDKLRQEKENELMNRN